YPSRPITVLWPFPPGTAGDTFVRASSQEATKHMGGVILVESRAGGGGKVALNAVVNADKDGYLLGVFNVAQLVVQPLASTTPESKVLPGKNYSPIVSLFAVNQALYVRSSLPFSDLKGFIAYAKANPGKLNYGSTGIGSASHLTMELLKSIAG